MPEEHNSPFHEPARRWWDVQLSGASPVCLCWTVINAFIRIGTNPRVFEHPLSVDRQVIKSKAGWINPAYVLFIRQPGIGLFQKMLSEGQAAASLVTDAHLAALANEHGCELMSTDTDFSRFPGIKWRNPLK